MVIKNKPNLKGCSYTYMETMHQRNTIKVRNICKQEVLIDWLMTYGNYKYGTFS